MEEKACSQPRLSGARGHPSRRWPTSCRSRPIPAWPSACSTRSRSGFTPSRSIRARGIYTPGAAVDHRYRLPALPADFSGCSVLDVGAFDGFYAFVAEHRGAERVLAIDNEQYVMGAARAGTPSSRAARDSTRSRTCSTRASSTGVLDAFDLDRLGGAVRPHLLLRDPAPGREPARPAAPAARPSERGRAGPARDPRRAGQQRLGARRRARSRPGRGLRGRRVRVLGVHQRGPRRLGRDAGFGDLEILDMPVIDGHPRILGTLATAV